MTNEPSDREPRECIATLFNLAGGQQWLHAHGINAYHHCCASGEHIRMIEKSAYDDSQTALRSATRDVTSALKACAEITAEREALKKENAQLIDDYQDLGKEMDRAMSKLEKELDDLKVRMSLDYVRFDATTEYHYQVKIKELEKELSQKQSVIDGFQCKFDELMAENKRLREALAYYSNIPKDISDDCEPINPEDQIVILKPGKRARAALEGK